MNRDFVITPADISEVVVIISGRVISDDVIRKFLDYISTVETSNESLFYLNTLLDDPVIAWLLIRAYFYIVNPKTLTTKSIHQIGGVTYHVDYAYGTISRGSDASLFVNNDYLKLMWESAIIGTSSKSFTVNLYNETASQYNSDIYYHPLTLLKRLSKNQRLFRRYILNDEIIGNFEVVPVKLLQHITGIKTHAKRDLYTLLFEEGEPISPLTRKYKMLIEKMN